MNEMRIVVGMLLLMGGCVQTSDSPPENPILSENDWMVKGYADTHRISLEQAREFFMKTYRIESGKDIVKNLPPRNENFQKDKEKMKEGSGAGLGNVERENYLQPDFYETFETTGKRTWTGAPAALPEVVGLFSVPAEQEATLGEESREFETYLFVGSAWGATYFQGIGFEAVIEPEAPVVVEVNPPYMIAGPAFPTLNEGWVERIRVKGNVVGNVLPGRYVITIRATNPPQEKQEEWANAHERYVNADTTFVDPRGLATLVLNVTE